MRAGRRRPRRPGGGSSLARTVLRAQLAGRLTSFSVEGRPARLRDPSSLRSMTVGSETREASSRPPSLKRMPPHVSVETRRKYETRRQVTDVVGRDIASAELTYDRAVASKQSADTRIVLARTTQAALRLGLALGSSRLSRGSRQPIPEPGTQLNAGDDCKDSSRMTNSGADLPFQHHSQIAPPRGDNHDYCDRDTRESMGAASNALPSPEIDGGLGLVIVEAWSSLR